MATTHSRDMPSRDTGDFESGCHKADSSVVPGGHLTRLHYLEAHSTSRVEVRVRSVIVCSIE